jgi:hypothetical protein
MNEEGRPLLPKEQAAQRDVIHQDILKKMSNHNAKVSELLMHAVSDGWVRHPSVSIPFLLKEDVRLNRKFRLNFKDKNILRLEEKVPTTEIERLVTRRNSKWVVLEEQEYEKVTVDKTGNLVFSIKKKGRVKKANVVPLETSENSSKTDENAKDK